MSISISVEELNQSIREWNEFQKDTKDDDLRDVSKVFIAGYIFGVVNTRSSQAKAKKN